MQRLHDQCVIMLSQDSFYRGLTPEEKANVQGQKGGSHTPKWHVLWVAYCLKKSIVAQIAEYNFDHPDAFDSVAILQCLTDLKVSSPYVVATIITCSTAGTCPTSIYRQQPCQ